jgi:hypothetical protein
MFEARPPALAGPQISLGPGSPLEPGPKFMRPSAPLSLSLKSWGYEARLPALAGPHVPTRPGAPLSPGLTEKTSH